MTPEAQRIAIAEACGWKRNGTWKTDSGNYPQWINPDGGTRFGQPHDEMLCVPDYLNSLDAMHEAEKACLTNHDIERVYNNRLLGMVGFTWKATASQKAEAFLRTLNLWTE
jgi:hypothetical protein